MNEADVIDRWFAERVVFDPQAVMLSMEAYRDYRGWATGRAYISSVHFVVRRIAARGVGRWTHPRTRRKGFFGVRLRRPEDDAPQGQAARPIDLVYLAKCGADQ
jgi:hypothetical protein